jgi:hypothetical protein
MHTALATVMHTSFDADVSDTHGKESTNGAPNDGTIVGGTT